MPVRYTFSGNLFRVNLEGSYTPEELMKTFMNAQDDPLFPGRNAAIVKTFLAQ